MSQLVGIPHSPFPWKITEASEKKGREIVDARGNTVAKLTALDIPNAMAMVKGVNLLHSNNQGIRFISDVKELEVGREYWLVGKHFDQQARIAFCKESAGHKYFEMHIWAEPDNNQAMQSWNIFGPLPVRPVPNFEALKRDAYNEGRIGIIYRN